VDDVFRREKRFPLPLKKEDDARAEDARIRRETDDPPPAGYPQRVKSGADVPPPLDPVRTRGPDFAVLS
jgi:hypothetical protein